jgi:hypothetical protein
MSLFTSGQTLKAALQTRVDSAQAGRLGSQRQNLGEGMMCPAGAQYLAFDVYGRPANRNTLNLNDSACSNYAITSATYMQYESNNRPMIPICAAGLNGGGDLQGTGRNFMPRDLYGTGKAGEFVRHYGTRTNRPEEVAKEAKWFYQKAIQPFNFSHDATAVVFRQ